MPFGLAAQIAEPELLLFARKCLTLFAGSCYLTKNSVCPAALHNVVKFHLFLIGG